MFTLPPIERFNTNTGARIYRIPIRVFPNGFIGYSYVVLEAGKPTLVDTGSGYGESNEHLLNGINALHEDFGEALRVTDLQHIIITHGHIDHFGGVAFIQERTGALIGIHQLDRRVLTNYEERVVIATKDLLVYLERAGIPIDQRKQLLDMYAFAKKHVRSVKVDFHLEEDMMFEGMEFIHTPGHCPGQVCILIGNVMISADHVLSHTSPHQAPESITHYTGLGHYRDSLRKIAKVDGVELALGGHEEPIKDFYGRIDALHQSHERKLNRILDIIKFSPYPLNVAQITQIMYPDKLGYDVLLAIEEAGAHVEYLYQHGALSVANLEEFENEDNPALCYVVA